MKRMFALLMALMLTVFVTACGGSEADKESTVPENDNQTEESAPGQEGAGVEEDGIGEEQPSGIQDDGRGEGPDFGEGIGEVVALSEEEQTYMLSQTTNSWLELAQTEKDDLVVLIGRTLEANTGFIVEDYDDLVVMLDRQMEQYYKNGVDEGVYATVCDFYGLEA